MLACSAFLHLACICFSVMRMKAVMKKSVCTTLVFPFSMKGKYSRHLTYPAN